MEPFIQDNEFQDGKGDMSSKDFLKRVELLMKKRAVSPNNGSSTADLRLATADLRISTSDSRDEIINNSNNNNYTTGRAPPPHIPTSSIYAQQQYLPYPNRHPTSDFVPSPIATTRHSSLHHHPSPTSPNTTQTQQQYYFSQQQQQHSQQQQRHTQQYHQQQQHNMNHPTSPAEYSPSPLRLPPNQQELHS